MPGLLYSGDTGLTRPRPQAQSPIENNIKQNKNTITMNELNRISSHLCNEIEFYFLN